MEEIFNAVKPMDETERRLADAERQIRELNKKIEHLDATVKPLTSKREFKNAVIEVLHEIKRSG
jgi:prefoldin subunit 5